MGNNEKQMNELKYKMEKQIDGLKMELQHYRQNTISLNRIVAKLQAQISSSRADIDTLIGECKGIARKMTPEELCKHNACIFMQKVNWYRSCPQSAEKHIMPDTLKEIKNYLLNREVDNENG